MCMAFYDMVNVTLLLLISPDLDPKHSKASPRTSRVAAMNDDPDFAEACQRATVQAIYAYQEDK